MIAKFFLPAAAAIMLLAACNPSKEPAMMSDDPLSELIPWDATREGVQTTDNGLQYMVLSEGEKDGPTPTVSDRVTVMYDGRLNDGTPFDGTFEDGQPASFGVGRVIPGWTQGLQLMSEGDDYVFYIPSELAYGEHPRPGGVIKPGDDLIFRIQLLEIAVPKSTDEAAWSTYTPWNSENPDVKKTEGAEGGESPAPTDTVVVYYEGRFSDTGEVFDSAFSRGEPLMFPANGVIPGWVEALSMMKPGDRWLVHIPSDLAYGERGHPAGIAPNTDLDFEVELVDVLKTN